MVETGLNFVLVVQHDSLRTWLGAKEDGLPLAREESNTCPDGRVPT